MASRLSGLQIADDDDDDDDDEWNEEKRKKAIFNFPEPTCLYGAFNAIKDPISLLFRRETVQPFSESSRW